MIHLILRPPSYPRPHLLRLSLAREIQHGLLSISSESKTGSSDQIPERDIDDIRPDGQVLLHNLLKSRCKKWGWVVYRCTYQHETTWQNFKPWIIDENREYVATSKAPTLIDHLDMVFFEDRARFDGASRDELRVHFKEWRADKFSRLGPADLEVVQGARRGDSGPRITRIHRKMGSSRFLHFVQVDEESL
ncbi:hypothetical protein BJX64DRAFT_263726 [Aspergillus heterothallicus]